MTSHSNAKSKAPQGKPSGSGSGGTGLKEVNNPDAENRIEDKYMDGQGQPDANVNERHPNRNTDKGREDQGKDTISI